MTDPVATRHFHHHPVGAIGTGLTGAGNHRRTMPVDISSTTGRTAATQEAVGRSSNLSRLAGETLPFIPAGGSHVRQRPRARLWRARVGWRRG